MSSPLQTILSFDNRLVEKLPQDPDSDRRVRQVSTAWSSVSPEPVSAPEVIAASPDMMRALGLPLTIAETPEFANVFAGNTLLAGMQPHATNYGGHQFGHWAGQLGDGRAITLGEAIAPSGKHWELQLKGAGRTPYSRHADGRAVLRSSAREFLCSEAMHYFGIPTTRALSLVATGDAVVRDMFYDGHPKAEPGAIVCRAAPSFIRFGHFQLPSARGDKALLQTWVEFCIARDFPHITTQGEAAYVQWFEEICVRTAHMIAHWMRVGFVHGVMNTDNMSVLGLTIDYGPYGFVDAFDPDFTPNTTDAQGRRYRFGWQPRIAYWNLQQLAVAIAPLLTDTTVLQSGLDAYAQTYGQLDRQNTANKLGLSTCTDADVQLMRDFQAWMHAAEADMTLSFNALKIDDVESLRAESFADVFYDAEKQKTQAATLTQWLDQYKARVRADAWSASERLQTMRLANPEFILRNWIVQRAIEQAETGDYQGIEALLTLLQRPYDAHEGYTGLAGKRPEWAKNAPGCSVLSCSS